MDHGIPEAPRILAHPVFVHREHPITLPKSNHIQPMPSPAFAITRTGKQARDKFLVGGGTFVGDKLLDLFNRWRQPGQSNRRPPNQRVAISLRLRTEIVSIKLGENETIP